MGPRIEHMGPEHLVKTIFNPKHPKDWTFKPNSSWEFNCRLRTLHCQHSFPILDRSNIWALRMLITKHIPEPKAIEVMSGNGWLSYWLSKNGVEIIATTDNHSWNKQFDFKSTPVQIEKLDCVEAVNKYSEANLVLMSWPYMDPYAHKVINEMRKDQWLLYIGEGPGGCTADDAFFAYIQKHCQCFESEYGFKQFYGIHDYPSLIKKK